MIGLWRASFFAALRALCESHFLNSPPSREIPLNPLKELRSPARISHKIRHERTKIECWCGTSAL